MHAAKPTLRMYVWNRVKVLNGLSCLVCVSQRCSHCPRRLRAGLAGLGLCMMPGGRIARTHLPQRGTPPLQVSLDDRAAMCGEALNDPGAIHSALRRCTAPSADAAGHALVHPPHAEEVGPPALAPQPSVVLARR